MYGSVTWPKFSEITMTTTHRTCERMLLSCMWHGFIQYLCACIMQAKDMTYIHHIFLVNLCFLVLLLLDMDCSILFFTSLGQVRQESRHLLT